MYTHSTKSKKPNTSYQSKVLPLLPAEIISSSKDEEKTLNRQENDGVACQHKAAGSPFDLKHKNGRVKSLLSPHCAHYKSVIHCIRNCQ